METGLYHCREVRRNMGCTEYLYFLIRLAISLNIDKMCNFTLIIPSLTDIGSILGAKLCNVNQQYRSLLKEKTYLYYNGHTTVSGDGQC